MFRPPLDDDPVVIRTHKALDTIQGAGLGRQFDALQDVFHATGDMLGFIAGCHALLEAQDDPKVRAALLHFVIGISFVEGAHSALDREKAKKDLGESLRMMVSFPFDHPTIAQMISRR